MRIKSRKVTSGVAPVAAEATPVPCMDCGHSYALMVNTKTRPDFDISILPADLQEKFERRLDGYCCMCGLYQDFLRYTPEEMARFSNFNKDHTVTEEAYHSFPVPKEFISRFEAENVDQRVARWGRYFAERSVVPKRVLLLRPMFGGTAAFLQETFDPEMRALEISKLSQRTVEERLPAVRFLDGQIHGWFEGPFLESEPYDAIFDFHTMVHCIDVHDCLKKLSSLLVPGGCLILSSEITVKPHNPFHILYASEFQWVRLLEKNFDRVDRIDDCDPSPPRFVSEYTKAGDSPDLVAWKRPQAGP